MSAEQDVQALATLDGEEHSLSVRCQGIEILIGGRRRRHFRQGEGQFGAGLNAGGGCGRSRSRVRRGGPFSHAQPQAHCKHRRHQAEQEPVPDRSRWCTVRRGRFPVVVTNAA